MASEKVTMILKSKTNLTHEEISKMTDAEGWGLIYTLKHQGTKNKEKENEICFTGFSPSDKDRLRKIAEENGLKFVTKVTKCLTILCIGENAGPAKLKQAKEQEAVILTEDQFFRFLETGEIPS
jgi:NAD-dependent DNA ligase